jgi:hypothetical protein
MRKGLLGLVMAATISLVVADAFAGTAQWSDGLLRITGTPGSVFAVFSEQPDGNYVQTHSGVLTQSGEVVVPAELNGPIGNGRPQLRIRLTFEGQLEWLSIPDEEGGWGWD